jgi:predicted MFS family arabinose efflux permease
VPKKGFWAALGEQQVLSLLRRDRLLAALFALQLFYCLGVNALYEFAPLWMLENLGFGSVGIAWVTAAQCAVMTAASVIAGKLRQSRRPLRRAGLLALCAALGLSALAVLPGQLGLAAIIGLGLPLALYNAVLPAWVSERFADYGQGRIMGLLSTIFCLANVLMALTGGVISMLSTRWIMGLGGMTCVIAALALLRLANQEAERPSPGSAS